jgi:hypothetical protein
MAETRFDDFLFTIVKETGGLEGLLHTMCSFLIRRTDFFYEADPGDNMGFPPGVALRMLVNTYETFQKEHYKRFPKKDPALYAEKLKIHQEKIKQEKESKAKDTAPKEVKDIPSSKTEAASEIVTEKPKEKMEVEEKKTNPVPVQAPQKAASTAPISTYNGASTSKYNWSQAISDVTLQVPIPQGTKGNQLDVKIQPKHIKIVHKPTQQLILEGELYEKVKLDDSTWSIDGASIVVTLEKADEQIWKTVIKGDAEIDATKVDNSKPISAFDDETQVALKKIMVEQQRKAMGLPSTDEEKQMEVLKQAWNSEGSPFKGQPFDPKKFNLPGANSFNIE